MPNSSAFRSIASLIVILPSIALSGCMKQISSTVPAFAQAAELTSTNVQAAFQTVQDTYYDTQVLNYAVTYTGNFDPSKIPQTWLRQADLETRLKVLQGLSQYASELNSLTGASDVNSLNTASTGVGSSLKTLVGTPEFKNLAAVKSMPSDFENVVATAVDALGNWLIQSKLHKELPGEIKKMDPYIQSICALLEADIGTVDQTTGHGNGLRQTLWYQYSEQIVAFNQYVVHNIDKFPSPDAKLAAIEKLPTMAKQRQSADSTLQQAQNTVFQLAKAHTELVKAASTKQGLTADLEDLVAEAQRLNTYYQSLNTSK